METNSPPPPSPSSSSYSSSSTSSSTSSSCSYFSSSSSSWDENEPDANGYLKLKNLDTWIQNNPHTSHLLVKHLELHFPPNFMDHEIDDSISQLTNLTHLTIRTSNDTLRSLPLSISSLHNLQHLEFNFSLFNYFPDNISLLNKSLTHLILHRCVCVKSIPETIVTLSKLTSLHLVSCRALTELTPCFGQLRDSLTDLALFHCYLNSLPESFSTLSNLTCLHLHYCYNLTEFPCLRQLVRLSILSLAGWDFKYLPETVTSLSNLTCLHIEDCTALQSLPDTMENLLKLETLTIENCSNFTQLPDNLKVTSLKLVDSIIKCIPRGLINIQHFTMNSSGCINDIPYFFRNLNHLANLHTLYLCLPNSNSFVKFPDNLEGLDELILLDIESTTVKYLPWSILKLPKLQFLLLPCDFRLETLPFHLNDSIFISTIGRHIRKTWKQLKQEIGVLDFPIVQVEAGRYPSIIAPPGYLSLHRGLIQWISDNTESVSQIKMLELELSTNFDVERTKNSIGGLPNLTHLFVTDGYGVKKDYFPCTFKGLRHLCLQYKNSMPLALGELSNLYSLDLIITMFPRDLVLPVSLRRLSLQSPHSFSFPASDSMAKLSNLHTLELRGCDNLASLPQLNIVTLKIDRIIESLPIGLRHLEILHGKSDCYDKDSDVDCNNSMLEHCLTQLVDLEMLSLTCYHIKSLPSMAGQHSLRVLLLKDCFALELLSDVEQFVELHTLDISGTSIESLPDGIVKLSKLQRLILPKCFTQKLPRNLEEVSIIDDTDESYYEHLSCYDSDSSIEGNDDKEVDSTEGVDEEITKDPVQGVMDELACEQNDVIAQVSRVSSSTMKRGTNEHGIICPSSKKLKRHEEKPSKRADGLEQKVSMGAAAIMETVGKPCSESAEESIIKAVQHVEVHLDGVDQSNIAQPNGSSSSFDFVKACYEGDALWIDFSFTSSFDQLNEFICKKFRLELDQFKIKYLDEDEEWLLMTCVSDLTHALLHTSSSGRKFVRLSITDKGS